METASALIAKLIIDLLSSKSLSEKVGDFFKKDPYQDAFRNALSRAIELFFSYYRDERYKRLVELGIINNPDVLKELSKFLTISEEPNLEIVFQWQTRNGIVDDFDLTVREVTDAMQMLFSLVESELRKEPVLREHFNSRTLHQMLLTQQMEIARKQEQSARQPVKRYGESWSFSEIYDVEDESLRQQLERAVEILNINYVDVGLFSLAILLETELKQLLLVAKQKGSFPVSSRDISSLAAMIDCVVRNNVFPDSDELHYLRKERNKRAHGKPPDIGEREKLMRWAGFFGDQYIKYIILSHKYQKQLLAANP